MINALQCLSKCFGTLECIASLTCSIAASLFSSHFRCQTLQYPWLPVLIPLLKRLKMVILRLPRLEWPSSSSGSYRAPFPASVACGACWKPTLEQVRNPPLRGHLVLVRQVMHPALRGHYTTHLLPVATSSSMSSKVEPFSWCFKDLKPPQHRGDSRRWKWRAPIMVLTWLVSLSSSQFFRFPSCGSCPIFQHGHGIRRHPETPKASVQL